MVLHLLCQTAWYYNDKQWTGVWSSREEGDIQDYRQAELPLKLSAETQRGKVNGEAFNLSVCKLNPLLPPILIEGEIRRGKMYAYAFAYVGGEKKYLYSFQVQRSEDEPVVTILPLEDPMRLLPQSARLVQRAGEKSSAAVSLADQHQEHPDLECPESPMEYMKRMREEERREIGVPGKREEVQPPPDRLPNTSFKRTPDGAA